MSDETMLDILPGADYVNPWATTSPSSTSVPTPETSVSDPSAIDQEQIYKHMRRAAESPEWQLSIETLIAMQPFIKAERIERFKNCRNGAYFYRHVETGKVKVMSTACRDRACPFCAKSRSMEVSEQITEWLMGMKHPRFLTLTMRSSNATLAVQIDNIYQAFRRFRLMKGMSRYLRSGVWFFQVTWNKERQQWHPHLHCIIVGKWGKWEFFREQWRIASKGSHVIEIQEIKDPSETAKYVSRYSARPYRMAGLELEQRKECITAFASRRLFGTWGPKPERPKVAKVKVDLGQWEPIGSFAYIHYVNHKDHNARLILEAWKSGQPLAPDIKCHSWDWSEFSGFYDRTFEPEADNLIGVNPGNGGHDGPESGTRKRKRRTVSLVAEQCLF